MPTYSLPSLPKWMAPPWCPSGTLPPIFLWSSPLRRMTSLSGTATSPFAGEPTNVMVRIWIRGDVAKVDVGLLRKTRIEGHADQAPLPRAVHLHGHERLGQQDVVLNDAEVPVCSQMNTRPSEATAIAVRARDPGGSHLFREPLGQFGGASGRGAGGPEESGVTANRGSCALPATHTMRASRTEQEPKPPIAASSYSPASRSLIVRSGRSTEHHRHGIVSAHATRLPLAMQAGRDGGGVLGVW